MSIKAYSVIKGYWAPWVQLSLVPSMGLLAASVVTECTGRVEAVWAWMLCAAAYTRLLLPEGPSTQ